MNKEWEKWTDEETKEFQDQFIQWYEQEKETCHGATIGILIVFGSLRSCSSRPE